MSTKIAASSITAPTQYLHESFTRQAAAFLASESIFAPY
jgi:hypothetical protein